MLSDEDVPSSSPLCIKDATTVGVSEGQGVPLSAEMGHYFELLRNIVGSK